VHLQRAVDHIVQHGRPEELDHRYVGTRALDADSVDQPRGVQRH
jgi:hypothetical protein